MRLRRRRRCPLSERGNDERERGDRERKREREREREANDKECKQDEVPICVRALFVPPVRLCRCVCCDGSCEKSCDGSFKKKVSSLVCRRLGAAEGSEEEERDGDGGREAEEEEEREEG